MADDGEAVRARNLATARRMMADFGHRMDGWFDLLHDDVVMEFPFGASIGMPTRIEGKAAVGATFEMAANTLGVRFHDVVIEPMLDPNRLLVQCRGEGGTPERPYRQRYVTLHEYRDGKLVLFREHFDTKIVFDTFGDLGQGGQ
jgi:ketosteroid isomerase-like protein